MVVAALLLLQVVVAALWPGRSLGDGGRRPGGGGRSPAACNELAACLPLLVFLFDPFAFLKGSIKEGFQIFHGLNKHFKEIIFETTWHYKGCVKG